MIIQVENLQKTYRVHQKEPGLQGSLKGLFFRKWTEKHALKGVNLQVGEGEILGLVGANGAGKTTLVKTLTGIIYPTSGNASVLGHTPWQRKNEFRKQIALIMGQKAQLWWDLPAEDSFLLLKDIYQIPISDFKSRLHDLTERLFVRHLLNIQVRRLSLGERMKMELVAALLHYPRVVFLDEPTIGLDLSSQRAIREFILEYQKTHQPTMIVTSHYMEDIQKLCKRIVIIRDGSFTYDGLLKDVSSRFGNQKQISIDFSNSIENPNHLRNELQNFGKVTAVDTHSLQILVDKKTVSTAVSELFQRFDVTDIRIEEEDIGSIIEAIQTRGLE